MFSCLFLCPLLGFACISCCNIPQNGTHTPAALQMTAPSCETLHSLHDCLTHSVTTCVTTSPLSMNLFLIKSFFFLLWHQKLLNSYHVCLHPSESHLHMCTLRVCVCVCTFTCIFFFGLKFCPCLCISVRECEQ